MEIKFSFKKKKQFNHLFFLTKLLDDDVYMDGFFLDTKKTIQSLVFLDKTFG